MKCRANSRNPFQNIDEAFTPFFNDQVKVTLKNGQRQTLTVSIFDDVEGEPISEDAIIDTSRKDIQLLARQEDWNFIKKIQRGDLIEIPTTPNKEKYSVESVRNDFAMGIIIKARQT